MNYYEYIAIDADDQTIACHPLIDACDARILFEVIRHLGFDLSGRNALDVGAGTGQVSRLLLGLPSLTVEALDSDPEAQRYFAHHPELGSVRFHVREVIRDGLPQHYDLVVARGVYHHIPKKDRPAFLRALCTRSQLTIIADEGLLEYSSADERVRRCDTWYGYVIGEARRRGLNRLAEMEARFLEHERLSTADDGLDFKESPQHLLEDAGLADLAEPRVERLGPWQTHGGGFFVAVFVPQASR